MNFSVVSPLIQNKPEAEAQVESCKMCDHSASFVPLLSLSHWQHQPYLAAVCSEVRKNLSVCVLSNLQKHNRDGVILSTSSVSFQNSS